MFRRDRKYYRISAAIRRNMPAIKLCRKHCDGATAKYMQQKIVMRIERCFSVHVTEVLMHKTVALSRLSAGAILRVYRSIIRLYRADLEFMVLGSTTREKSPIGLER